MARTNSKTANANATNKESETMSTEQSSPATTEQSVIVTVKNSNAYTKGIDSLIESWNIQALSVKLPADDFRTAMKPVILPTLLTLFDNDKMRSVSSYRQMIEGFNAQWAGLFQIELKPVDLEFLTRKDWRDTKSTLVLDKLTVYKVNFVIVGEVEETTVEQSESDYLAFTLENLTKVFVETFGMDDETAEGYAAKLIGGNDDNDLIVVIAETVDYKGKSPALSPYVLITFADTQSRAGKNALSSRLSVFGGTATEYAKKVKELQTADESTDESADVSAKAANDLMKQIQEKQS